MPDIYTHTNVERDADGRVFLDSDGDVWVTPETAAALRDFFLDELGLWRDEETGALVLTNTWTDLGSSGGAAVYEGSETYWGFFDAAEPDRYDAAVSRWVSSR